MYTLLRHLDGRTLATELPALGVALITAESFFKFHSFTLECLCFLGVWGLGSALLNKIVRR